MAAEHDDNDDDGGDDGGFLEFGGGSGRASARHKLLEVPDQCCLQTLRGQMWIPDFVLQNDYAMKLTS